MPTYLRRSARILKQMSNSKHENPLKLVLRQVSYENYSWILPSTYADVDRVAIEVFKNAGRLKELAQDDEFCAERHRATLKTRSSAGRIRHILNSNCVDRRSVGAAYLLTSVHRSSSSISIQEDCVPGDGDSLQRRVRGSGNLGGSGRCHS